MAVGLRYVSADPRVQTGPDLGLSTLSLSHSRTNPPPPAGPRKILEHYTEGGVG